MVDHQRQTNRLPPRNAPTTTTDHTHYCRHPRQSPPGFAERWIRKGYLMSCLEEAMRQAITRLKSEKITYKQMTKYQLKVGLFNFYPGKGTIYVDGAQERHPHKGLNELISLVQKVRSRQQH
jgi:hypothetical protein